MSKSILVIDTPENCRKCPCHFTDMVTFNPQEGETFFSNLCGVNNKGLDAEEMNNQRPDWCPLKEAPRKLVEENQLERPDSRGNMEAYGRSIDRYAVGYNACIDDLLKERDEN